MHYRSLKKPLLWLFFFILPVPFSYSSYQEKENTGLPRINPNDLVVKHTGYTVCFSTKMRQAKWVAYELTKEKTEGMQERVSKFTADPELINYCATNEDYKNKGYDRGHLAPAKDMAWSAQAMKESFYFSNISPQEPGFNRGIWKKLEEKVRDWAVENGRIEIVTGPVPEGCTKYIGEHVAVPVLFYKVIFDCTEPGIKMAAFVMPNKSSDLPVFNYMVTVDSVEKLTGIDFFPALPDDIEEKLERESKMAEWEN